MEAPVLPNLRVRCGFVVVQFYVKDGKGDDGIDIDTTDNPFEGLTHARPVDAQRAHVAAQGRLVAYGVCDLGGLAF